MISKTPSTFLRQLNERRLLNAVHQSSRLSRADLERKLNLAAPTISRIVDRLLGDGWLRELGLGDTTSGRKPMLLDINPIGIGAVGVELGRGVTRVLYTNLLAEIRSEEVTTNPINGPSDLAEFILSFMERHGLSKEKLIGVGIAAPGAAMPNRDMIVPTPDIGMAWFGLPIADIVSDRLGVPAYLANDANAAALGETWFGHARNARHAAFVLVDIGLGAGLTINGSIYEGASHKAGEFSHTIVNFSDPNRCVEGHNGCVESEASAKAILDRVRRLRAVSDEETIEDVIRRASAGQSPDREVMDQALTYLAAGVVNIIRICDLQIVVLGGRLLLSDPYMYAETKRRIERMLMPEEPSVFASSFGLSGVAMGAATLVLQTVYDHTQLIEFG